jgi:hypothetical protein
MKASLCIGGVLLAVLAVGCGGEGESESLSADDRAFVQEVISLQQAGDWDGLEELVGFTKRACTFGERGMSFNPPCHEDEREGDLVDAFLYAGCGAGAHRPGDRTRFITGGEGSSLTANARFFGVVRYESYGDDADYHVAFEYVAGDPDAGFWFGVRDRRIIAQRKTCGSLANAFGPDATFLMRP